MTRTPVIAMAILLALSAPASAAPADVADLFPPNTLAYAELHNPAELGPQLAALFKGTPFEDSIPFIHGKKGEAKTMQELKGKSDLAGLALLASPEVLAEFRKVGGIAIGLVGFNERGEPEVVLAVLTGDSAAAGLAARAYVTMSTSLRKVGEVSKVPVFQHRPPAIRYDPNGNPQIDNDKPPAEGPHEPTFAYTPGLFVAGTSKNALAPVVKRFLGEEKALLGSTEGFKAAAATYRQPGLFFYVNAPEFVAKVDGAGRARGAMLDSDLYAWLKLTANQKAVKSVAGCVRLRDGGLALTVSGRFDPAQKSPLMDFFAGPGVKVEQLHHARKPASFAAVVNLPTQNRAAALVGFLDALAKANGEIGRLPSEAVKELEDRYKVQLTTGLLAKVKAVTVVVPARMDLPKGATAMPILVLHLDDATAASGWEEFLPKLIGDLAGEKDPPQPSSETVGGVKVLSLAGAGLPWKSPIHHARKDAVLAVGQDRKLVAAAITPDSAASVVGDKGLSVPAGDVALLGTLSIGDVIAALGAPPPQGDGAVRPVELRPIPDGGGVAAVPPEKLREEVEKARKAFLASFKELPPAVVTVRRSGDELRVEVFQPKVQGGGLTPVINAGVTWFDKQMNLLDPNRAIIDIYDGPGRIRRGWKW